MILKSPLICRTAGTGTGLGAGKVAGERACAGAGEGAGAGAGACAGAGARVQAFAGPEVGVAAAELPGPVTLREDGRKKLLSRNHESFIVTWRESNNIANYRALNYMCCRLLKLCAFAARLANRDDV